MLGTIAGADTHLSASATWTALADGVKTSHLVKATRFINSQPWKGSITLDTQADSWPRLYVTDQEGRAIDSDTVPPQILEAVYELAEMLANGEAIYPDYSERGVKSEKVKAGTVATETTWNSSSRPTIVSPDVEALVSGFLEEGAQGSSFDICRA